MANKPMNELETRVYLLGILGDAYFRLQGRLADDGLAIQLETRPPERDAHMIEAPPKPRRWTLAEVKALNEKHGGRFFSRENMRFCHDTMRSFAVRNMPDGKVFVERVRPRRDSAGRSMGGVGELHRVDLETGGMRPAGEDR